ncbi:flagellar motor protein [Bacterioplanes sanyensis]|uniref:Flagellar motor protein n=1 Tax=Bacterioplanes sanyensis TaxID=1249553 RepID=A0A222FNG6_9GAMM|nr:MotA/TolQ/ExbB proton channel family protein [Bacterioplanes sanyensis]ASP40568.1 flagellar motor protein [Bacterioplanes sanyensis]
MDRWSLAVVALAVLAVLLGFSLEGGSASLLLNGPAALIVFGGAGLATLAQIPVLHWSPLLNIISWLFMPPSLSIDALISKLSVCANAQRKDGVLALEQLASAESEPLLQRALTMLADGYDDELIDRSLQLEIQTQQERDNELIDHLDQLAGYLPTLGIVGAVLGLMQVLSSIQQPDTLAAGIATAFVATFYGVAAANIVVIPLSSRLRQMVSLRGRYQRAMVAGILSIRSGVNPAVLRYRLQGITL